MSRASKEQVMMEMAWALSTRSTCDRLNVGALITQHHRVISTGYNGNVAGMPHCGHLAKGAPDNPCVTAVHAEANAIVWAARTGVATLGGTLWTTHQPCLDCAKLIVNAGITRVWYDQDYRLRSGLEFLIDAGVEVFRLHEDNSSHQVTR